MKRRDLMAVVTAAGLTAVAGMYRFTDLIVKHYPPTPYDDLLARLTDREPAIKLGAAVRGDFDLTHQAARLRATLANQDLATAINADIAAGRLTEVEGWLMPETLVALAALAARA